ncbi:MAG: CvpA family protein [Planctomycetes bacterium]|nr:CvpA family protein [Planctomycetota bacterium]
MIYALNIVLIALVAMIAYWWANQGLFSAIIHLLCVIVAGAIALAFWEPLTVGLLLRGNAFDNYAWGVSLVGLFVAALLALRLATNKLIPANVDLPHWANLGFGFPVGAASGVLTIGLLIIGIGFIQSEREIFGYVGSARSARGQVGEVGSRMWLPFHKWTDEFYSQLSVGSLSTPRPLRHYYPNLSDQAVSLIRDSYRSGRGQVSLLPSTASVDAVFVCPDLGRCAVRVKFGRGARDFGEQLTISAAQLRLIAWAQGKDKPYISFPVSWAQEIKGGGMGAFLFDDPSHYITSIPGREAADVTIEFPLPAELEPRFIQIKGTRYDFLRLQKQTLTRQAYEAVLSGMGGTSPTAGLPPDLAGARPLDDADISLSNSISPVVVSSNQLPGTMKESNKFLVSGDAQFKKGRGMISRQLRIKGIDEPGGTRIVKLNVSRGRSADIFGPLRERAGAKARPVLIDSQGHQYSPIGFIHENPEGVRIFLDPARGIASADDLPHLPTTGEQELRLVFRVTDDVTIVAFRLGDVTVGTCNLIVTERRR